MQSSCKRLLLLVSFPAIQFNCYSCFRKDLKKKKSMILLYGVYQSLHTPESTDDHAVCLRGTEMHISLNS